MYKTQAKLHSCANRTIWGDLYQIISANWLTDLLIWKIFLKYRLILSQKGKIMLRFRFRDQFFQPFAPQPGCYIQKELPYAIWKIFIFSLGYKLFSLRTTVPSHQLHWTPLCFFFSPKLPSLAVGVLKYSISISNALTVRYHKVK